MPVAVSMHQQIADVIREAIQTGGMIGDRQLGPGAQLPTEPELMTEFDASRGTVRQALATLTAEGLLETRGRRGTFIRRLPLVQHPGTSTTRTVFAAFAEQVAAGRTPREDFAFRIEPATAEVAGQLQIAEEALVAVRSVARYIDNTPWGRQTTWFPLPIAEQAGLTTPRSLPQGSLAALAEAGYPRTGTGTRTRSRPATTAEQYEFGLGSGVWMLEYKETGYSRGQPVWYSVEVLPADRNEIVEHHGDAPGGESPR